MTQQVKNCELKTLLLTVATEIPRSAWSTKSRICHSRLLAAPIIVE
jgi:hypothetical protein